MASNDDKKNASSEQSKDIKYRFENPFITFRRFADEKIATITQSIVGLPSAVSTQLQGVSPDLENIRRENARNLERPESLRDKFPREYHSEGLENQNDQETRREKNRLRWKHIRDSIQQGPEAPYPPPYSCNMRRDGEDAERPTSDRFAGRPTSNHDNEDYNKSTTTQRLPFFNHMDLIFKEIREAERNKMQFLVETGGGLFQLQRLLPFLVFSPYSPIFLSNQMDPFPYCDAFEDLLLASRGMDMVPADERLRTQQFRPSPFVWLMRLQARALLEVPWREYESSEYEDNQTKLAMYKQFLSSAFHKEPVEPPKELFEPVKEAVAETDTPGQQQTSAEQDILSTLTRTESKRFPDGRVETKVVLIKRFQDGSETRTETVNNKYEGSEDREDFTKDDKKDERKGWFWG